MNQDRFLMIRVGTLRCALPLTQVAETLRPLSMRALANVPEFVSGVAVIRGQPTPVVDMALLLGVAAEKPARWVRVHAGQRPVALAVEAVIGIPKLDPDTMSQVPPLLSHAQAEVITAISTLDQELLLVLQAAGIVSDEVWSLVTEWGAR